MNNIIYFTDNAELSVGTSLLKAGGLIAGVVPMLERFVSAARISAQCGAYDHAQGRGATTPKLKKKSG